MLRGEQLTLEKWEYTGLLVNLSDDEKIKLVKYFNDAVVKYNLLSENIFDETGVSYLILPIIRRLFDILRNYKINKDIDLLIIDKIYKDLYNSDWYKKLYNEAYYKLDSESELVVRITKTYIEQLEK
jgi:hypothetical protein